MTSDVELLELEIETLWRRDARRRLTGPAPHLVLAVARDGWALAFGAHIAGALAGELGRAVAAEPPPSDPSSPPGVLHRCRDLLEPPLGPADIAGGPGFVIPPGTSFRATTEVQTSEQQDTDLLLNQDVGRLNWPADEWRQLIAGELGPWAMAIIDRRVVSTCHSARLTDRGAEAGVWTDPAFRGQGHAAAVTAAWAQLLTGSGRTLFYSTSAANVSSQRVAARLRLRPIGWLWKLASARPAD
jgi:hypothetical protein